MKYKIIGLSATALVLLAVTLVSIIMPEDNGKRYIEHIDNETKEQCTEHTNGELCSHLPVIKIDTEGVEIPGKPIHSADGQPISYTLAADGNTTIKANLSVIDNKEKNNHIADKAFVKKWTVKCPFMVSFHSEKFLRIISSVRIYKPNKIIRFFKFS